MSERGGDAAAGVQPRELGFQSRAQGSALRWAAGACLAGSLALLLGLLFTVWAHTTGTNATTAELSALLRIGMVIAVGFIAAAAFLLRRDSVTRSAAETAVLESHQRLNLLLATMSEGVVIVDARGRILFSNAASETLLDMAPQLLARRSPDACPWRVRTRDGLPLTPQDLPFTQALREARPIQGDELDLVRTDGQELVLANRAAPLRAPDGTTIGVVLSFLDITEHRQLEQMKEHLVSSVSHELRTPLASMHGFAELLLSREYPVTKQREYIKIIHGESVRLAHLLNDFLDIQRMQSGREVYDFQTIDPLPLLRDVVALFETRSPTHRLCVEVEQPIPKVCADPDRLRQVLCNLVSNAIKFSPDGGDVTVAAMRQGPTITFRVTDRGVGIPPEALPKLFQKFFRVEHSQTKTIAGTGLGLALVREIIEAHGGRVWVDSTPGKGSSFFFCLHSIEDSLKPAVVEPDSIRDTVISVGTADVLLIEDDKAFARDLIERLDASGFSAVTASSPEVTRELLRSKQPRLVVLDTHLESGADGWDVLIGLKQAPESSHLPILLVSASDSINARGLALSGAEFLVKPVSPARLIETVRKLLPSPDGKRVLLVEDDVDFRHAMREALARVGGLEVVEAASGQQALAVLGERMPDLLLLDLFLPDTDGFDILTHLRSDRRALDVPLLVISGRQLTTQERTLLRRRMASLVNKDEASVDHIARMIVNTLVSEGGSVLAPR